MISSAPDWQLIVDLGSQLKFPDHIASTNLRPDMVMFSNQKKKIVLWELTVSWEDNFEAAHERKLGKYQELVEQCRDRGWQTKCEPIEVGARGFTGKSLNKTLNELGLTGFKKRRALRSITEVVELSTRFLWLKKAETWTGKA